MAKAKLVKVKKRCCRSSPRCRRCPVVCRGLAREGLAQQVELRIYKVSPKVTKKQLKSARG